MVTMKVIVSKDSQQYITRIDGRSVNGLKKEVKNIIRNAFQGDFTGTCDLIFEKGIREIAIESLAFKKTGNEVILRGAQSPS
ncbi:MAG: hypothetical protein IK121_03140 [Lachnospiraceae bacterium]|nr:hypothetical protein [Lachnospiraceae bacterium]